VSFYDLLILIKLRIQQIPPIRRNRHPVGKLVRNWYMLAQAAITRSGFSERYRLADSNGWGGKNVFDVYSKSQATTLDGIKYSDWQTIRLHYSGVASNQ
jgi:hypothetical protein